MDICPTLSEIFKTKHAWLGPFCAFQRIPIWLPSQWLSAVDWNQLGIFGTPNVPRQPRTFPIFAWLLSQSPNTQDETTLFKYDILTPFLPIRSKQSYFISFSYLGPHTKQYLSNQVNIFIYVQIAFNQSFAYFHTPSTNQNLFHILIGMHSTNHLHAFIHPQPIRTYFTSWLECIQPIICMLSYTLNQSELISHPDWNQMSNCQDQSINIKFIQTWHGKKRKFEIWTVYMGAPS